MMAAVYSESPVPEAIYVIYSLEIPQNPRVIFLLEYRGMLEFQKPIVLPLEISKTPQK